MKLGDEGLAGPISAAGSRLRSPLPVTNFVFAHQLHAVADQFHGQLVVAVADALVVGHEEPACRALRLTSAGLARST